MDPAIANAMRVRETRRVSARRWAYAVCAWLQGLLLALLLGVGWEGLAVLCVLSSLFAGWVAGRMASPGLRPRGLLVLGLLTVGNTGMLAGWWADSGFAPAIQAGACACHCGEGGAALGASWMVAGMALACLICPGWVANARKLAIEIVCMVGMIVGMFVGPLILPASIQSEPELHLLLAFATMSLGMLAGALGVRWAVEPVASGVSPPRVHWRHS